VKTLRIAAAALLIATGLAVATPASADDNGDRKPALCDYRVCLLVVAKLVDTDGDGVTDIDEKYFGTDVLDRLSMPAAQKVIDTALMRELPSFESHLTELVVLPQMTTDFSALATAVGLMDLPTDSWGTKNAPGLLGQLAKNGLDGITSALGIARPGSGGHELPEGSSSSYFTYMQQVMDGEGSYSFDIPGSTGYGANSGKQGGETVFGPTSTSTNNGTIAIRGEDVTTYADGSKDRTKYSASQPDKPLDGGWVRTGSSSTTTSTDKDGYTTSVTKTTKAVNTNSKTGESNSSTTVTTTTYARSGQATSSHTTTTKTETKNGETTTTTETTGWNTHDDPEPPATTTETCTKDCKDHGMVDPDQVQFGILTPGDYARVIARINSVRTPGPDTGVLTDDPPRIPTKDIYSNYTGDGVVVLSSTPNPQFNIAQPEYNSELAEMAQLGGTVPPNPNADDPTGYWPDKP
jgi:hypothetical protein